VLLDAALCPNFWQPLEREMLLVAKVFLLSLLPTADGSSRPQFSRTGPDQLEQEGEHVLLTSSFLCKPSHTWLQPTTFPPPGVA